MKKESELLWISVCLLASSDAAGGKKHQTGSNWMQSARFLADFSASAAYTPTPWGETSRNPRQIRRWHIKNRVTKKGSNGCQRCGSSSSFLLGSFYCSPVYWGCMVSEGNALSGLPCRSGIWSWRLCDSLGWGIAVSAEQETRSWSMGLLRQACVQGSYGMAPLCCAEAPLPAFSLVNNHTSPFFFLFCRLRKHVKATYMQHRRLTCRPNTGFSFKRQLIRKNEPMLLLWRRVKIRLNDINIVQIESNRCYFVIILV